MEQQHIVIRPSVAEQFSDAMARGRVIFFSAPCGFGKTVTAQSLLAGRRVRAVDASESGFTVPQPDGSWDVLLIDQAQSLLGESDQQALCSLIREQSQLRFVLLSRGVVPGWLAPFQFSGLMTVLDAKSLLLDRETAARLFERHGVTLSNLDLTAILKESIGYPLALSILARRMGAGERYDDALIDSVRQELFIYFEDAVYLRFDLPIRRFLLELAPFEEVSPELARMVSGDVHAGELLRYLQRNTTMFQTSQIDRLRFYHDFRTFLLWEMDREYTEQQRRSLFARGGLYYELQEDYSRALDCYRRSGDHRKVSDLLIKNAELHPGMAHYEQMEPYYRSLPDEEIFSSPALMQGMSMLCALCMDYAGSERYYEALRRYAVSCRRGDASAKQARSRLAWLDISLPQRGASGMIDTIVAASRLLTSREITLAPFSVTSTLPSILNGGKDFSDWSRRDDLLFATLRRPVEAILGADGVGLADCAMAESKFEQGEDISARMLSLVANLNDIQQRGTPDIEFAVVGLLARSQMDAGRASDAQRTVQSLRERFAASGSTRFLPNIDALLCRIALRLGDMDAVADWYRTQAPRDVLQLRVMRRYQYFTQAMAEIALGDPAAAPLTLAPLGPYCTACGRHLDAITLGILTAIARERNGSSWQQPLLDALTTAQEYRFIRPVSQFGPAVRELLERLDYDFENDYGRRLLEAVRRQSVLCPDYLRPRAGAVEPLTGTEMQVLHLLCANRSNAEIGQALGIKLPTVKSHVSHILSKLGVRRRSEACAAAEALHLI